MLLNSTNNNLHFSLQALANKTICTLFDLPEGRRETKSPCDSEEKIALSMGEEKFVKHPMCV